MNQKRKSYAGITTKLSNLPVITSICLNISAAMALSRRSGRGIRSEGRVVSDEMSSAISLRREGLLLQSAEIANRLAISVVLPSATALLNMDLYKSITAAY